MDGFGIALRSNVVLLLRTLPRRELCKPILMRILGARFAGLCMAGVRENASVAL